MAERRELFDEPTHAMLMTMSDAMARPLWISPPGSEPGYMLAGSPIHIVSQMPDVAAGSTPIAYGNWAKGIHDSRQKSVTMLVDPYSAGFCTIFKFEASVGGATNVPERDPAFKDSLSIGRAKLATSTRAA